MVPVVAIVAALAVAVGVWAAVFAVRDRPVVLRQLIGAGVVEVGMAVQIVVALVAIAGGHEVADPVTFWGYLITVLLMFPLAGAWALAERTRWSSVVLVVAALSVIVMQLRVVELWLA